MTHDTVDLRPGDRVVVHGLPACTEFNDRRGKVERPVMRRQGQARAFQVRLSGDQQLVQVLASNLRRDSCNLSDEDTGTDSDERAEASMREMLAKDLFKVLDASRERVLRDAELYHFAVACGFGNSRESWRGEYEALCTICGVSGFRFRDFLSLISNQELPTHCATAELPQITKRAKQSLAKETTDPEVELYRKRSTQELELAPRAKEPKMRMSLKDTLERKDAIQYIFASLDSDGDKRLNLAEMQRFAMLCGFMGEWQDEYEVMCEYHGIDPELGPALEDFDRIVSDGTSHAYRSDEELQQITVEIQSRRDEIAQNLAAIRIQANTRGFISRRTYVQPTTNAPGAPPNARRDRDRGAEDESVGWESMDSGLEMPEAAPEPPWAPESESDGDG